MNNLNLNPGYLIYHPKRAVITINNQRIYHDSFTGNEDPYIWNEPFLHTFCHISQISATIGQINFWVSGDSYPNFSQLFCDCVFVVAEKHYWTNSNSIDKSDPLVDSEMAFQRHYNAVNKNEHPYKRKRRYTLKADTKNSFQPQTDGQNLIDILPFLEDARISKDVLIKSMTSRRGSRPFKLPTGIPGSLYDFLSQTASIKLTGDYLKDKHP